MVPRLIVVLFVILVEFSTGLATPEGGARVWAVPSIQKVRPNDPIEDSNLVWSGDDKIVRLAGARGEHVPFQLVISVPPPPNRYTAPAGGFWVEMGELVSAGDKIARDQLGLFLEDEILCYGKSSAVGDTGFWPDALAPLTDPFGMGAVLRRAVGNRPIWIDIHVPPSVEPGIYRGKVAVTQDERPIDDVVVELEVYDFVLPEESHMLAYIGVSESWFAPHYPVKTGSPELRNLLKTYYDFLYTHRMEPWFNRLLQPKVEVTEEGKVTLDFDEESYRHYLEELKTKRVVLRTLPNALRESEYSSETSEVGLKRISDYVEGTVSFFRENGWADRLVFNSPIDEPNTAEHYEETRKWAELVRGVAPEIPFLVTEAPVPDRPEWGSLTEHANNFSIHGNRLNDLAVKRAIKQVHENGGETTWYISCDQVYPQPNYFIDAPAMDPVMVPWITWKYGMDGILYWAVNFWRQTHNPWEDPVTYLSGFFCSEGGILNGEGSMLYPGNSVQRFTGQQNVAGPVSSIRFELLREGIEDYEYLWLLRSLGEAEFADSLVRDLVVDVSSFSRNVEAMFETRVKMARKIEELTREQSSR